MGFNIQIPNTTFTKYIGSTVPSGENLIGYWLFDGTQADSIKNRVTGISGALIGNPTVSGDKINTDKANGFITDITISGEKTFIAVAKTTTAAILVSSTNYDAGATATSEGIAVFNSRPMIQLDGASKPQSANLMDLTKIHFIAGSVGSNSNNLFVSAGGALVEETATHTGNLTDSTPLRIGGWGVNSTSLVGSAEVYAVLVFDKKLSSAEVQAVFNFLKHQLKNINID